MKKCSESARNCKQIVKKLREICKRVEMLERRIPGGYKDVADLKMCAEDADNIINAIKPLFSQNGLTLTPETYRLLGSINDRAHDIRARLIKQGVPIEF